MTTHYTDQVLAYLKEGNTLSQLEATELFGTTRLSAVIKCLRKRHVIETIKVETVNRNGVSSWYGRYKYIGPKYD